MKNHLAKLDLIAEELDNLGLFKYSDALSNIMVKLSQLQKPKVLMIELKSGSGGLWDINEDDLAPLKKICDLDRLMIDSMTETELANKCAGYDYLMLNMDFLPSYPNKMEKLTEKFYRNKNVKNLKGINVDMTDADFFSPWECKRLGIVLQTCPDTSTTSVSESALCEIMLHAKKRHLAYKDEIYGKDVECRKGINLRGENAGIIGYGNIGKAVGRMLRGVGMNIMSYDINNKNEFTMRDIFEKCKVITIHVPALQKEDNSSNIDLIDSKLLNLCNEAIIINLATDIIVNNDDMISALKSGKVIGYSVEPGRKTTDRLKKFDNVHISPCSYDSDETRLNVKKVWINNMISAIKGKPDNVWDGSI